MDSTNNEMATLNPKRKVDLSLMKNEFKKTRFYQSVHPQIWSLPDTIIFYITQNPSTSKLYQKMTRTCKFFFAKNPIIICDDLIYSGPTFIYFNDNRKEERDIWRISQKCRILLQFVSKNINLSKILARLWIIRVFRVVAVDMDGKENLVSSIFPMIFRCEAGNINFYRQNISLKEYAFLASKAAHIDFSGCVIKSDDDGSIAPFEKVVEYSLLAKNIIFNLVENNTGISSATVKKLLALPNFSSLNLFTLERIPDSFDVETFFDYIKETKHTKFSLYFSSSISDTYKNRLQKIVDEILATENRNYRPPWITFLGQNDEKYKILSKLCIESRNFVE